MTLHGGIISFQRLLLRGLRIHACGFKDRYFMNRGEDYETLGNTKGRPMVM